MSGIELLFVVGAFVLLGFYITYPILEEKNYEQIHNNYSRDKEQSKDSRQD